MLSATRKLFNQTAERLDEQFALSPRAQLVLCNIRKQWEGVAVVNGSERLLSQTRLVAKFSTRCSPTSGALSWKWCVRRMLEAARAVLRRTPRRNGSGYWHSAPTFFRGDLSLCSCRRNFRCGNRSPRHPDLSQTRTRARDFAPTYRMNLERRSPPFRDLRKLAGRCAGRCAKSRTLSRNHLEHAAVCSPHRRSPKAFQNGTRPPGT